MKYLDLFVVLIVIGFIMCAPTPKLEAPYGLLCELLREPSQAVITDQNPEFSWIVNDTRRGAVQSAFQILVASDKQLLHKDQGDMWDSGKVRSSQSVSVEYQGKALQENSNYFWKVKTYDGDGKPSDFSRPQQFRTGVFNKLDRNWPFESDWVKVDDQWLLENRQRSTYFDIDPKEILKIGKGHYFVDFGKAAFATLKISMKSDTANDSVIIYMGSRREGDAVHKHPGKTNIGFKKVILPLKQGKYDYKLELPRHISHYPNSQVLAEHMTEVLPFRYAEIINCPSNLEKKDIKQFALFYYFDDNASFFTSSNDNLNQVWDLCKYSLKATPFLALYADGNRERMPYEADAYIQQLGHYCVDREYSVARYTNQFLFYNPSWPTEWHSHSIFMAFADFMYTGNTENIQQNYDVLKAKTLMALSEKNNLISTKTGLVTPEFLKSVYYHGKSFRDIVDWPAGTPTGKKQASNQSPLANGETDGHVFMPYNTVVNAFYYKGLDMMAKMALALNKEQDAAFYKEQAKRVKKSINELLFDKEKNIYVDGIGTDHSSLHANMFPLAFGIVPDEYIPSVIKFIKTRNMACSVYGAQYLLEALYNCGEAEYALQLMTSESQRSWMNMINVGSTITTEAWDEYFKPNLGWTHAWGAAPANIIPRKLFGIEPLEPGFSVFKIKPQPADLEKASVCCPTVRGEIVCDWKLDKDRFNFDITIPANCHAQVWLPCVQIKSLTENDKNLSDAGDIKIIEKFKEYTVCEIPSGQYSFSGIYSQIKD